MAHILLLAEPSLTIQRVVQLTFANEDIDVVVASDGAEAVSQAERLRPSIVLADVALARMNGYDLAAHFKRTPRFAGIPVVLLSGAFERVDPARAAESGCDLVLSKPFEPRHLLAHIKGLLPNPPAGATPEDTALDGAVRATPAGFYSVPPREGHATAIEPVPVQAPVPAPALVSVPAPEPPAVPPPAPAPVIPFQAPSPEPPEPVVAAATVVQAPPAVPEPPPAPVETPVVDDIPYTFTSLNLPREVPAVSPAPPAEPARPRRAPEPGPPLPEPVPSFEMLALTNKSMHLVPPPAEVSEVEADTEDPDAAEIAPAPEPAPQADLAPSHDLGDLIPALDDYFDQLDAAFASGVDTAFRRAGDASAAPQATPHPQTPVVARPPVAPPAPVAAPPVVERRKSAPPPPPPVAPEPQEEERGPAISPFSTLRLESPAPRQVPAAPSATIDDAYDALMKQLQEPKGRPSVVALRADDELLVERAVERVLAQLDSTVLREAMTDVVTNLTKKVIQEEIERIRRP